MPLSSGPLRFVATARLLPALFLALPAALAADPAPRTISFERIWDGAPHNAFTDLIRFRGQMFCTFREGTGHVPGKEEENSDGVVRILAMGDDGRWSSAGVLAEETIDLRDPHFSIAPDARRRPYSGSGPRMSI